MKKKFFYLTTVLFSVMFILSIFSGKVQAATKYNSEISYEENYDGTITVSAYGTYIENATIPSKINGKTVTTVGSFKNCKDLKTVTLPDTITKLSSDSFYGCTSLISINIPSKITEIPGWAFQDCSSLKSISLQNVTKISYNAFDGCSSLSSVTLGNKLTTISSDAFRNCSSLTSITLPDSLTYLGSEAFMGSGLTSITLPSSITEMGTNYGAFEGCKNLKTATVNVSVSKLPKRIFCDCTSLTTVNFGGAKNITEFESYTLSGCTSLTTITFPPKLQVINRGTFQDCSSLTSITLPNTLTEAGYDTFYGCTSLTSIKIPYGVQSLGAYTFANCTKLKTIYFTKSIQEIGYSSLYNLTGSNITVYGYSGTAAKEFASTNGCKYVECTPVSSISLSGASSITGKGSTTLSSSISPSGAFNKTLEWSSSNTSVATVNSSGTVTAVKSGTATITAKATDGTDVKATYNITIKKDMPFADVDLNDWHHDAVKYCYTNNIITGMTSTKYSPNTNLTRGMLVTILYRMEGSPSVSGSMPFTDVSENRFYSNAVKWAASAGVVNGYGNGIFKPDNNITREQLACILFNYADYKGKNTSQRQSLDSFSDGAKVSAFAKESMQWAVSKGIINGSSSGGKKYLKSNSTATRAEATAMIYNYCMNVMN